jgi:acyl-CoA thioester hydrolase
MSTHSPTPTPDDPEWRFCHTVEVRFRDIDMFNHVNNAVYLTYVESARVAYYSHVSGLTDPHDFDMTLASAHIDFLTPVFFPATINVFTRTTHIGTKSWTLEHQLRDAATSAVIANCSTVIVHFDHETGKSKPLTREIVGLIEAHEDRSLRKPAAAHGKK